MKASGVKENKMFSFCLRIGDKTEEKCTAVPTSHFHMYICWNISVHAFLPL